MYTSTKTMRCGLEGNAHDRNDNDRRYFDLGTIGLCPRASAVLMPLRTARLTSVLSGTCSG